MLLFWGHLLIKFKPIWSDSLGAKSYSIYLELGSKSVVLDPGVAIMHPGYPAPRTLKVKWFNEAYSIIKEYLKKSNFVIITHYHHDHYLWRDRDIYLYEDKTLLIKNPNYFINDSQFIRGQTFYEQLIKDILSDNINNYLSKPEHINFNDPVYSYKEALNLDLGDYNNRRKDLLRKGRSWYNKRVSRWLNNKWVIEVDSPRLKISFADSKEFHINDIIIKFTPPLYHGIEYARIGWIIALTIIFRNHKILYTSDVQGPVIEDYATWIINENPEILIIDGPPTYLIPYAMNMINFKRTIRNIVRIINNTKDLKLMIIDHHLTREPKYKERLNDVYLAAKERGLEVSSVAEYLGLPSAFDKLGI